MTQDYDKAKQTSRFTVEVAHEPIVAPTAGWAELKHKSPLYASPYRSDFMILRTETEKETTHQYSVTQFIQLDGPEEDVVLEYLRAQESVTAASVAGGSE